jgi:hypothetical protein
MEKIKAFFKKVGSVIYDLFIASNRWMHLLVGGVIYVAMMAAIVIWTPYEPIPMQCCFGATLATLIAMCSKEYADKAHGDLFDWKDILAGVTVPIVMDIAIVAMMLFR